MVYDIVAILMNRDGISREDARSRVLECKRLLEQEAVGSGDYEAAIDIIASELGLEPDYMFDIIDFE